jgi:ubiquitin-like-conjugating enzyme ATG3
MGGDSRWSRYEFLLSSFNVVWLTLSCLIASVDPAANPGDIDDIPDLDGPSSLSNNLDSFSLGGDDQSKTDGEIPSEIPDMDDIPDMEEEGLEGGEDEATAKTAVITVA